MGNTQNLLSVSRGDNAEQRRPPTMHLSSLSTWYFQEHVGHLPLPTLPLVSSGLLLVTQAVMVELIFTSPSSSNIHPQPVCLCL